jgi:hypothetical protein
MPAVYTMPLMPKSNAMLELPNRKHSDVWAAELTSKWDFNTKMNGLSFRSKGF